MQSIIRNSIDDFIGTLKQTDYEFDTMGRLVIRPQQEVSLCDQCIEEDYKSIGSRILDNQLLNPDDKMIRQSIKNWIDELQQRLDSVKILPATANQIAEIFNQSSLIMYSIGRSDLAKNLCYEQINFFQNWSRDYPILLKYIVQPWINLSRLDRYTGYHDAAIEKIQAFVVDDNNFVTINNESISFKRIAENCAETKNLIDFCYIVEIIKTNLFTEAYQRILELYPVATTTSNKVIDAFISEARLIALANSGYMQNAFVELINAKTQMSPVRLPVFLMRECEFYINRGEKDSILLQLNSLKSHYLQVLSENILDVNDVYLVSHLCKLFIAIDDANGVFDLGLACYKAACVLSDEILQAKSLVILADQQISQLADRYVTDLAHELYVRTDYQLTKKILNNHFQYRNDLSLVSQSSFSNQLYERLTQFTSNFTS